MKSATPLLISALALQAGVALGSGMTVTSLTCDHGAKGNNGQGRGNNGLELVVHVAGAPAGAHVALGVAPDTGTASVNLGDHGCDTETQLSSWADTSTDSTVGADGVAKFRVPVTSCEGATYVQAAFSQYKNAGACTLSDVGFMPEVEGYSLRLKVSGDFPDEEEARDFLDDVLEGHGQRLLDFDGEQGLSAIRNFEILGANAPVATGTDLHLVVNVPAEYYGAGGFESAEHALRVARDKFQADGDKKGHARRSGGFMKSKQHPNADKYQLADSAVWRPSAPSCPDGQVWTDNFGCICPAGSVC